MSDIVERLYSKMAGLCSENPADYFVGLTVADCVEAADEITRLRAANTALREALDLAMAAACKSCAAGFPTDKTWEGGDSFERGGLYHPDRNYYGTGYGGGYHKCRAWKARAALEKATGS